MSIYTLIDGTSRKVSYTQIRRVDFLYFLYIIV